MPGQPPKEHSPLNIADIRRDTEYSSPSVEDRVKFKESRCTLKLRPQLLDVEQARQRTVQFRHAGRGLPILRFLVETQQMLLSFKLDMFLCGTYDGRERDAVLLGQ